MRKFVRDNIWLTAIFLGGLILRLSTLDLHGFWGDEITSLDGAALGFPAIVSGRFGYLANQTPLHYILVFLTSHLADPGVTSIFVRLPSAIAGSLTIPSVYLLGKAMFGKAEGLMTALLVALSATSLNFSQDLRLYALMMLLTTLAVVALLKADATNLLNWWIVFVMAEIANVANAYVALTLSTPVLLLCLAYIVWRKWRGSRVSPKAFYLSLLSSMVVLIGILAMILDMLAAPRISPDLSHFSPVDAFGSVLELTSWFTQFGIDGPLERIPQLLVLLVALAGLLGAFIAQDRSLRRPGSGVLAIAFIFVPAGLLAVFATTSVVFQRYALFALPFYLVLAAHGIVVTEKWVLSRVYGSLSYKRLARGVVLITSFLLVAPFAYSSYAYESLDLHSKVAYRPDYRGLTRYLSKAVKPSDIVVFVDDPLGYTIANFYWKSHPPCAIYDARDPRLYEQRLAGDIYWIVNSETLPLLHSIANLDTDWDQGRLFESVGFMRESGSTSIIASADHIVSALEASEPGTQVVLTLRGTILQAQGRLDDAAQAYRQAGTYFPVGDVYLRTAMGYDARGMDIYAWREALISKFWQPFRPQVHQWLAAKLKADNFPGPSRAEAELAQLLEAH